MDNPERNNRTTLILIISLILLLIFSVVIGIVGFVIGNSLQKSNSGSNADLVDLSAKCLNAGGNWVGGSQECERVSEPFCRSNGGKYDACASPCRNAAGEVMCIQMCVQVCSFK